MPMPTTPSSGRERDVAGEREASRRAARTARARRRSARRRRRAGRTTPSRRRRARPAPGRSGRWCRASARAAPRRPAARAARRRPSPIATARTARPGRARASSSEDARRCRARRARRPGRRRSSRRIRPGRRPPRVALSRPGAAVSNWRVGGQHAASSPAYSAMPRPPSAAATTNPTRTHSTGSAEVARQTGRDAADDRLAGVSRLARRTCAGPVPRRGGGGAHLMLNRHTARRAATMRETPTRP